MSCKLNRAVTCVVFVFWEIEACSIILAWRTIAIIHHYKQSKTVYYLNSVRASLSYYFYVTFLFLIFTSVNTVKKRPSMCGKTLNSNLQAIHLRSWILRTLQDNCMCSCLDYFHRFRCFDRDCFGNDFLLSIKSK